MSSLSLLKTLQINLIFRNLLDIFLLKNQESQSFKSIGKMHKMILTKILEFHHKFQEWITKLNKKD